METVYLETSFVSYLVARPSRDLIIAGHQKLSHDWWTYRRPDFNCVISEVVLDEASQGDPSEAAKRLSILADIPVLAFTTEADIL